MPESWRSLFGSYFSISTPHLGISEKENSYINKGIGMVTGASKLEEIKELYLSDSENLRATFLYRLAEGSSLDNFDRISLFHSSAEAFCPVYSSRIQTHESLKYFYQLSDTSSYTLK